MRNLMLFSLKFRAGRDLGMSTVRDERGWRVSGLLVFCESPSGTLDNRPRGEHACILAGGA